MFHFVLCFVGSYLYLLHSSEFTSMQFMCAHVSLCAEIKYQFPVHVIL